jgi:hypothetical protein
MFPWNTALVLCLVKLWPVPVIVCFRSRRDLLLENFALRQQLAVLKRRDPRPRMAVSDRLFWVLLRRFWSPWKQAQISRSTGNGGAMAPRGLQSLLDLALAASNSLRQEVRQRSTPQTPLPPGGRESNLGLAADPWRTKDAGLGRF